MECCNQLDEERSNLAEAEDEKRGFWGVRHVQFLLLFFAITLSYAMRTILSVAIIPMTSNSTLDSGVPTYPEWKGTDTLLSSFFWGSILTQVFSGQMSERFGGKWLLLSSVGLVALLNVLVVPMAALLGSPGVMLCRVAMGLFQGLLYPAAHHHLSKWTPLPERGTVVNFIYNGSSLGTAICMLSTGYLADTEIGWPLAFYLYGGLGVAWAILWAIFGSDCPSTHTYISSAEKKYIESNTMACREKETRYKTPWRAMMTSAPFWAVVVVQMGQSWGSFTLLTHIPSYMSNVMGVSLKSNSLYSALPYLAQWLLGFLVAPTADKMISNRVLTTTTVRRIAQGLSNFLPAAALLWLAFLDKSQQTLAIWLLVIAVGIVATTYCGYIVNFIDLAPNFAGTMLGFSNTLGTACSILGTLSVGFFGKDKTDPILWQKVFLLAAGVYIASGIFYSAFSSGDLQPWNEPPDNTKEPVKNEASIENGEIKKTEKERY